MLWTWRITKKTRQISRMNEFVLQEQTETNKKMLQFSYWWHLWGHPQLRSTPSEKGATTHAASARVWGSWAANWTIRGRSPEIKSNTIYHHHVPYSIADSGILIKWGIKSSSCWSTVTKNWLLLVVNSLSLALTDLKKSAAMIMGVKHTSQLYFLTKDLKANLEIRGWKLNSQSYS